MVKFINTIGNSNLGIGICDRCHTKAALVDLVDDGDVTGLKVHAECRDTLSPYKMQPKEMDSITLPFTRPDLMSSSDGSGSYQGSVQVSSGETYSRDQNGNWVIA